MTEDSKLIDTSPISGLVSHLWTADLSFGFGRVDGSLNQCSLNHRLADRLSENDNFILCLKPGFVCRRLRLLTIVFSNDHIVMFYHASFPLEHSNKLIFYFYSKISIPSFVISRSHSPKPLPYQNFC